MNNKKTIVGFLLSATALLAAMGCWFCWHCPPRVYAEHALMWRQLVWNGIGLAAFAGAWAVGWKRLLKAAPWLMAAWIAAFVMAQFSLAVRGAHRWLSLGPVRINVVTLFMPAFALFVAWLHEKRWIRPWMEWMVVAMAVIAALWMFARNGGWQERLAAFFNPGNWMHDRAYMARQLQLAFDVSKWFGDSGRSLGFLPCPESDGMMSASALMFGKWFPSAVTVLFSSIGAVLTFLWRSSADASKRRYVLLFGLWLIVPAAYCLLHSLALLPVAGMSPALASFGGTAVVMAWFGIGALAAMVFDRSERQPTEGVPAAESHSSAPAIYIRRVSMAWGAIALLAVVAIAVAPGRKCWSPRCHIEFAEPRPSDVAFGEFGLTAKRGRILAADGTPLAYTVRAWRFYLDPCAADLSVYDAESFTDISEGLGVPMPSLLEGYIRTDANDAHLLLCEAAKKLGVSIDSLTEKNGRKDTIFQCPRRYIFLKEVPDGGPETEYFERRRHWLTKRAGLIREPVQKRVYPLGAAAVNVVGFMIRGTHTETPVGAGGLESACNKVLAGTDGVYDEKLPMKDRRKKVTPQPGEDVHTTLVPSLQKSVAEALAAACATNGAESAWGLVMKIPTGEIEAMASWPTFDPAMRRNLDAWNPSMAVNRAAQTVFEPGGLAKPIVEAIAFELGVAADGTNVVYLTGVEKFHAALRRFGFGEKTRTAGIPGEEMGILVSRPECWKTDKTAAMHVGAGYGFAVTGLQIAQAYATLANHGSLVRPVLIAGGMRSPATNATTQAVSPAAADAIARMLKSPVSSNARMAEKDKESGRSFYSATNFIASCAGYCPGDSPQHVVVVSFVKPRTAEAGEDVARPVLEAIMGELQPLAMRGAKGK